MRCFVVLILMLSLIQSTSVMAEEDEKEYAKAALNGLKINHFAEHISLPLEMYFNLDWIVRSTTRSHDER